MPTPGSTGSINLTTEFSPKVMERFKLKSVTEGIFSKEYSWTGVETVKISEIDTVPLNDYNAERVDGGSRYGELINLGDKYNEYPLKEKKSFIFAIDNTYNTQQKQLHKATRDLKREVDEVVIPYVDKYRLRKMAAAGTSANKNIATATLTTKNAIETIMAANAAMSENLVPETGRVMYIGHKAALNCKLAEQVVGVPSVATYGGGASGVGKGSIGEKAIVNGILGEIDGCQIKRVPTGYLPNNVEFMIVKKGICFAPKQLQDFSIHPGAHVLNGKICTGLIQHDCFVPAGKEKCIFVVTKTAGSGDIVVVDTGVLELEDGTLNISGSSGSYTGTLDHSDGAATVLVDTVNGSGIDTCDVVGVYSSDEAKVKAVFEPRSKTITLTPLADSGTVTITVVGNGKIGFNSPANCVLTLTLQA